MTNKNIPTLRFSEFNNEWVKKKIVDFGEIVTGSTPSTKVEKYYANSGIPWITPTDIEKEITIHSNKYLSDIGAEVARIVPENSILVTSIASIGKNTILGVRGSFNQQINAVIPKREYSPYFLFSQSKLWSKKMKNLAASGTMQIINKTEFSNLDFYVPASEEQSAIGTLFQTLDELLSAYKDNLANYQAFKASMLSKMFPKAGQTTPEIRLEGFNSEWEEKKLGDLGSVAMNKRIFKDETSESGEIPFYKIGTFGKEADSYISRDKFEEYKSKYPYPEIGDILISASGSIGRTIVYNGEEAYYQDSNIVWLKHEGRLDNNFLKQFYNIVRWSGIEGTTIKRLYNKNILETSVNVPSLSEQQAIGSFFSNLDELISTYQEKIVQLETLKKKLLQDMFV